MASRAGARPQGKARRSPPCGERAKFGVIPGQGERDVDGSSHPLDATGRPMPQLLTRAEAASMLRISQRKLSELQASGLIPFVRISRSVRFDVHDLQAWIEANRFVGSGRAQARS